MKWLSHKLGLTGSISSSRGFYSGTGRVKSEGKALGRSVGRTAKSQGRISSWAGKLRQIQAGNVQPIFQAEQLGQLTFPAARGENGKGVILLMTEMHQ